MHLLQTTTEPGRLWTGNLSASQITELRTAINPDLLGSLTHVQLDNIFLPLSRILAEGCLNLNHHKLIQERQHELTETSASDKTRPPYPHTRYTKTKSTATRNPAGRLLHRTTQPKKQANHSQLQPVLLLPTFPVAIQRRYSSAILTENHSKIIITQGAHKLYGYHFQQLAFNNCIHDVLLLQYLRLLVGNNQGPR